ncbi:MAG TPA: hypothetical protein DHU72_01370 [Rikenellaceae bacterium]|nr:hypothetical protein [Rikenellaceae bacterium]
MRRYFIIAALSMLCASCCLAQELSGQQNITLDRCRELASESSHAVRGAEFDVRAAEYQKREARWEYFPRVSFSALGFYSMHPMLDIGVRDILGDNELGNFLQEMVDRFAPVMGLSPTYTALKSGYTARFNVVQPIYAGGRIVSGNKLADMGLEAATLQKSVSDRKEYGSVDELFWQVITLQEKAVTLESATTLVDALYNEVDAAFRSGLVTEDEFLQVKLKRNELRASAVKLDNGLKLSKMNLLNAIGVPYSVIEGAATVQKPYLGTFDFSSDSDELLPPETYFVDEETVASSLDESRLLELSVESKVLEKRMELGETLPQIAVGASYGYSDFSLGASFNGTAFATLQIPISDWGKTSMKMKRLQAGVDKARYEKEYMSEQLVLLVRKTWVDLCSCWDEMSVCKDSRDAASGAYFRMKKSYEAGSVTASELLKSATALRQCEDSLVEAECAYRKTLRSWRDMAGK